MSMFSNMHMSVTTEMNVQAACSPLFDLSADQ